MNDSSTLFTVLGIKFNLELLIATLTFLILIIGGVWRCSQNRLKSKPRIIDIVSSHNGSKIVLSIKNNSNKTIEVEKHFIKPHKFLFLFFPIIPVKNPSVPEHSFVSIPPGNVRDSSVFPPDNLYITKYKVFAVTSGGTSRPIVYNPLKVKGLKIRSKM